MILVSLALFLLVCTIALTVTVQYRRSVLQYRGLAESLCDPESWKITFLVRMVVLRGKVDGLPIQYAVLGNPQGGQVTTSYLLLQCPVMINLRVYAESDSSRIEEVIRSELEALQQIEGFRAVILTPAASPFLGKLLSRPLGFTYDPGILLWKLGPEAFNHDAIRADLAHLVALFRRSR